MLYSWVKTSHHWCTDLYVLCVEGPIGKQAQPSLAERAGRQHLWVLSSLTRSTISARRGVNPWRAICRPATHEENLSYLFIVALKHPVFVDGYCWTIPRWAEIYRYTGHNDAVGGTINLATKTICDMGARGEFHQTPLCPGGIVCGSGLAFLRSPHRQFCGSLCFDRRQLARETKPANWYVSNGGGLLGMHNYYMVTPEGNLIINLFGGCCMQIYMIWLNSINREIQRARARRLINYIVKLWYHQTLDE